MDEDLISDEPEGRSRRRAAVILLATALAAVLVIGAMVWLTQRGGNDTPVAAPTLPAITSAPPVTSAPTPSPTPTPTKKPIPHEHVAAAAPSSFKYSGHGFTIKANVCGMENVRPLDPPGEQHHTVCWVQHDFGYAPGTNGKGTTYVLGHAWGQDPLEVLNKISAPATKQMLKLKQHNKTKDRDGIPTYPVTALTGDTFTLTTPNGQLRYTVRDAYAVAKLQAGLISSLMAENTPNRVVLITCAERNHVDYDDNIIVEAYLTSSVASGKSKT